MNGDICHHGRGPFATQQGLPPLVASPRPGESEAGGFSGRLSALLLGPLETVRVTGDCPPEVPGWAVGGMAPGTAASVGSGGQRPLGSAMRECPASWQVNTPPWILSSPPSQAHGPRASAVTVRG